ncbi:hypothetical protein ABBQ32_009427 [Trebouxia sp. C0010 RCD-2024]
MRQPEEEEEFYKLLLQLSSYGTILAVERQTRCGTAPTCRESITQRDETAKSHLFGSTEVEQLRKLVATHPAAVGVEWSNHVWDSSAPVLLVNRQDSLSVCQVSQLSACLIIKCIARDGFWAKNELSCTSPPSTQSMQRHLLSYWMSSQALLTFGAVAEPWLRHKP